MTAAVAGIPTGARVALDSTGTVVTLDTATTASIAAGKAINFHPRIVTLTGAEPKIKLGQSVTAGAALEAGTVVAAFTSSSPYTITVSKPIVSALSGANNLLVEPRTDTLALSSLTRTVAASPTPATGDTTVEVTVAVTVTAGMAVSGTNVATGSKVAKTTTGTTIHLDTATSGAVSGTITVAPLIAEGQVVYGHAGIPAGTTVAAGSVGTALRLSAFLTQDVPSTTTLTFSDSALTLAVAAQSAGASATVSLAAGASTSLRPGMYV